MAHSRFASRPPSCLEDVRLPTELPGSSSKQNKNIITSKLKLLLFIIIHLHSGVGRNKLGRGLDIGVFHIKCFLIFLQFYAFVRVKLSFRGFEPIRPPKYAYAFVASMAPISMPQGINQWYTKSKQ